MRWTSKSTANPSEGRSFPARDREVADTCQNFRQSISLRRAYTYLPGLYALLIPHRLSFGMPGPRAGYTLLETAMVMAMISVLALISVPHVQGLMQQYRLHGASRQIMSDLMFARMKAVSQSNEFKIFFLNSYQYFILDDHNNNGTADSGEPIQTKDLRNSYSGVSVTKATANPIFHPRGTASAATITISNKEKSKDIKVNLSGRVKIVDIKP